MTPIGPVGAISPDSVVSHTIRRNYPFVVLPTQVFQTFTTPTNVPTVIPPHIYFRSGATVESNKLYEAAVEAASPTIPVGEMNTVCTDYVMTFDCYIDARIIIPGNIDSTGFIGIEIASQDLAVLSNTPLGCSIQLKRQINDPTKFMLSAYSGSNQAGVHIPFTVPIPEEGGTTSTWGSKLRIFYDPVHLIVRAYVNDILRAETGINGFARVSNLIAGILLYSGIETGVCAISAMWAGAEVVNYNAHMGDNSQV